MLRCVVESFERGVCRHGAQRGGQGGCGRKKDRATKGAGGERGGGGEGRAQVKKEERHCSDGGDGDGDGGSETEIAIKYITGEK